MSEPTTSEERLGHLQGRTVCQCGEAEPCFTRRLIADVERLEQELASERVERRAAASALYRVEAQHDKTVGLLEKEHLERLSLCWPADDCRPCHEHRYYCAETLKGVCRFLADPSTDTPKESA